MRIKGFRIVLVLRTDEVTAAVSSVQEQNWWFQAWSRSGGRHLVDRSIEIQAQGFLRGAVAVVIVINIVENDGMELH